MLRAGLFVSLIALALVTLTSAQLPAPLPWGYRNGDKFTLPGAWNTVSPKCQGQQQSPINIDTDSARYDPSLKTITVKTSKLVNFGAENSNDWYDDGAKETWSVTNTGNTCKPLVI